MPVIEERVDISQVMRLPGARTSSLLGMLDSEGLDTLLHTAALTRFGAHDTISPRHAPDDALHVLVRGAAVQHSWPSDRSREYFVCPLGEGELVGITDVLTTGPVRRETRSLGPAVTIRIPGPAVRGLLQGSHAVAAALARATVLALQAAERDHLVLATGDAMARVTCRLVELAERWGVPGDHGIDVDLPLTQEQLGAWSGVSRETTVKSLQWLREQGMIATSRRHVVVRDLPGLEELARRRGVPIDGDPGGAPRTRVRRDRRRGR